MNTLDQLRIHQNTEKPRLSACLLVSDLTVSTSLTYRLVWTWRSEGETSWHFAVVAKYDLPDDWRTVSDMISLPFDDADGDSPNFPEIDIRRTDLE